MPPPSRPDIEGPDASGMVVLSGTAPPETWIYADNETTGNSAGQRTQPRTGTYRLSLLASIGDRISMFYRMDTEDSMAISFVIPTLAAYPRGTGGGNSAGAGAAQGGAAGAGTGAPQGGAAGAGGEAAAGKAGAATPGGAAGAIVP